MLNVPMLSQPKEKTLTSVGVLQGILSQSVTRYVVSWNYEERRSGKKFRRGFLDFCENNFGRIFIM